MVETKPNSPHQRADIFGSTQTKNEKKELITLRGITTSQVNQALKATNPYPARVFLKVERSPSTFDKGEVNQEQDIPVIFRVSKLGSWIRPQIPTNSQIEVKGYFDNPKNGSNRKSFTAYSYQVLACPSSQKKPYHCPIDCPCLKGKDLRAKAVLQVSQVNYPYWKQKVEEFGAEIMTKAQELEKVKNYA